MVHEEMRVGILSFRDEIVRVELLHHVGKIRLNTCDGCCTCLRTRVSYQNFTEIKLK